MPEIRLSLLALIFFGLAAGQGLRLGHGVGRVRPLLVAGVAGAGLALVRLLEIPIPGARAAMLAALLALAVALVRQEGARQWLRRQLDLVLLRPGVANVRTAPTLFVGLACVHFYLLTAVARSDYKLDALAAALASLLMVGLILLPQLASRESWRQLEPAPLYPVLLIYGEWLLRTHGADLLPGMSFPAGRGPWSVHAWRVAWLAYSLAISAVLASPAARRQTVMRIGIVATIVGLGWLASSYAHNRTFGATGSDPYAYAQMAVDLSERGTPLHRFAFFEEVYTLAVSWDSFFPSGYHPPREGIGGVPSVWPLGAALILALAHRLGGDHALYLTTPTIGLISAALTMVLALALCRDQPLHRRYLVGGVAVAVLATTFEQLDRGVVPLGDLPAQLFTTLAVLTVLSIRGDAWRRWAVAAGLCLGFAYLVRHTQATLVLLAAIPLIRKPRRQWLAGLLALALGAAPLVAGDLAYHWAALGSPLHLEQARELSRFGLASVPSVMGRLWAEFSVQYQFWLLWPLAAFGLWTWWRRNREALLVIGLVAGGLLVVSLPYEHLMLRDLLSLFPLAAVLTAEGATSLCLLLWTRAQQMWARPALVVTILAISYVGSARLPDGVFAAFDPTAFGLVTERQRTAFDELAAITGPEAVVGAIYNQGAVELRADRRSFSPLGWQSGEWARFVPAAQARGYTVYVLYDSEGMREPLQAAAELFTLVKVARLEVPVRDTSADQAGWLFRVEVSRSRRL